MSGIYLQCPAFGCSDRPQAVPFFVRQEPDLDEPDSDEDEEEEDGEEGTDNDDDEEEEDGYSE